MVRRIFGLGKKPRKSQESDPKSDERGKISVDTTSSEKNLMTKTGSTPETNSAFDDRASQVVSSLGSSIFSKSKLTYSTGASSSIGGSRTNDKHIDNVSDSVNRGNDDVGKPLRVVNFEKFNLLNPVFEEDGSVEREPATTDFNPGTSSTNFSRHAPSDIAPRSLRTSDQLKKQLSILEDNLVALMDDIHQNVTNISKAVIQAIEYFKKFLPNINEKLPLKVTFARFPSLRVITKIVLHFLDNLLRSEVFGNSRSILLRRYLHFLKKMNINMSDESGSDASVVPYLSNFCIDSDCYFPNKENIGKIIEEITRSDQCAISDQEGAFIAPVVRGLSRKSGVLTVMFGVPNPQQEHYDIAKALYSLYPDVHFFCAKDYIKPCAEVLKHHIPRPMEPSNTAEATSSFHFEPPYRLAVDAKNPPISMSLSSDNSLKMTGTLGGYLFPQIEKDSKLSQFEGASFAITCSHVVLSESHDYPYVSIPSRVLQKTYQNTLREESKRYPKGSKEEIAFLAESERITNNLKWQDQNKFGQVVWGERSIVNQKLSDFAIIKVDSKFKCENFLGLGLTSVPDPTLKFQNLYVKEKILKMKPGMEVFKIGASTNYTSGQVNAAKLVYWADGKLQSSEFVVSSPLPLFASSGDSGSWILTKLEDRVGLGVVGMLHSYDGEQRQFGLFSPIGDILERLHEVTGVLWDVDPQIE